LVEGLHGLPYKLVNQIDWGREWRKGSFLTPAQEAAATA